SRRNSPPLRTHAMTTRILLAIAVIAGGASVWADELPPKLAPNFQPPAELAADFGTYRSPLKFDDGTAVRTAADWKKRRAEILNYWHGAMGEWPALIAKPKLVLGDPERREGITQHRIKIETAAGRTVDDAYLL